MITFLRGLACCALLGWASNAFCQQYPFLPVAGSPKSIKKLFQDSRGRLWAEGPELACFDGSRFFYLKDYGFPAVESYAVAEDPGGAIWIAAETGVFRFAGDNVELMAKGVAVSVVAASADMAVAAIGPLGRGFPSNTSLIRMRRSGSAWTAETVATLDSPGPLTVDSAGILIYPKTTAARGEIRWQDVVDWHPGSSLPMKQVGNSGGEPVNGTNMNMRDRAGCNWSGGPRGVFYNCGDGLHPAPFPQADVEAPMHEGSDGRMLLWGPSMLAIGRPGSFQIATRANGLPGLTDAIAGRDGTIWLATNNGLYRFASPFHVEYWTIREGLAAPPWSITRLGSNIYAGLDKRIVVLNKDRLRWDTVARFAGGGLVSGLLGTSEGNLLASFIDAGAVLLRTDGTILAQTGRDHPAQGRLRLTRTPDGQVWIGGATLARVMQKGSDLKFDDQPLLTKPSGNVLAIKYEDHTHRLWSCYNGGLVVRDERGNWREFTTRDGLQKNGCWSLAPLPNGDVWYAYFNLRALGLLHLDSDGRLSIQNFSPDRIPEPGNDAIDTDQNLRLWRAGDLGIYVADPSQAKAGNWLQLNQGDGFPANGMNSGSVFSDSDGSMWWGSDNDLAHYIPPPDLVIPQFSPQVYVSAFSWNNQVPRLAEAVDELPHGSLVAHLGSLQFERRNGLQVRYRILPEQTSWRETKNLDVALSNLSYGAHKLEVQARVFLGPWSPGNVRSFRVIRPLWTTWPLLSLYCMTVASLLAGAYLLYRRRKEEEAELLPDLAEWRLGALLPEIHELAGIVLDARFEAGELLARGGFANVLNGYDHLQKQRCAVKVFRGEVKDKNWTQRSFKQEVAALEKVRHPNVVSIYAHGNTPSGAPYLVMEFIEGRNLREILEQGALSPKRTGRLLHQLSSALDAIHAEGIFHRDVKPENVIVRSEGTVDETAILIDFSIAIVKDADETLHGLSRAAGSFDYMAPEQAVGYAQPSSDVYSLAKLVIEMLTGQRLSQLLPTASIDLADRVQELLMSLRQVRFSAESINMFATALEFDPSRRPAAAGLFARSLVQDLESDPTSDYAVGER